MTASVGLIANPASGRDIRRLVAHASVFTSQEKINLLRRVLAGLAAAGVKRVLYMPDPQRLVARAFEDLEVALELVPALAAARGDALDTAEAARAMRAAGAGAIVSLGGDGTQRALARGDCEVPLLPISTGTNNVFPVMVEGTVAGLAAGAVAMGVVDAAAVASRCKRVELECDGAEPDLALVDAVALEPGFVASRAIWEPAGLREMVLTRAHAHAVGLAGVGGQLDAVEPSDDFGLHVVFGDGGPRVRAALAPGLVRAVGVARLERIPLGAEVVLSGPALLALDGERESALARGARATLRVTRSGPPVIDVARCLAAARAAGFLREGAGPLLR